MQLIERIRFLAADAGYAEALWALDQAAGRLDLTLMLRDTPAALAQLPELSLRFRKNLPRLLHPILTQQLEAAIGQNPFPVEAYNLVPGRDPQTGSAPNGGQPLRVHAPISYTQRFVL